MCGEGEEEREKEREKEKEKEKERESARAYVVIYMCTDVLHTYVHIRMHVHRHTYVYVCMCTYMQTVPEDQVEASVPRIRFFHNDNLINGLLILWGADNAARVKKNHRFFFGTICVSSAKITR